MLAARKSKKLDTKWKTGEEVFHWWIEDKNVFGQISIAEWINMTQEEM